MSDPRGASAPELLRAGRFQAALAALAGPKPAPRVELGERLQAEQDLLGAPGTRPKAARSALALVRRARRTLGAMPELDALEGAVRLAAGDARRAAGPLERAAAAAPDWAWARHWRGRLRLSLALDARRRRLEGGPSLSPLYEAARADFDAAVSLAPGQAEHRARRSLLLASFDRYDEALRDLDEALRLDPGYDYCLANRAEVLADMDRGADALRDDDELVARAPRAAWALAYRGRDLGKQGRFEEARRDLLRAIKLLPRCAELHAWLGELFRRRGDWAQALTRLDLAVRADPRSASARVWRARVRGALGLRRGAFADLKAAASLSAGLDETYRLVLGEILFKSGRYEEAAREFELARPASPRQTWSPRLAGGRAVSSSRAACAADHDAAVAARPRDPWPLVLRARLLLEDGMSGRRAALNDLERALLQSPLHPWARAWRGEALCAAGETAAGLRDLDVAVRSRPRHAPFLVLRAEALVSTGNASAALRDLDAALAFGAGAGLVYALRGRSRALLGDAEGAEADLAEAVLRGPKLPEWHLERARLLRVLGRPWEARDELEAARRLERRRGAFQPSAAGGAK